MTSTERQEYYKLRARKSYSTAEGRNYCRSATLKHKYGITLEDRDRMITEQNNLCALCKQPLGADVKGRGRPVDSPVIDHDHETGKVRGILHSGCNAALGHFKDDPAVLQLAMDYLNRSK